MKSATLVCWLVSMVTWKQMVPGCQGQETTTPEPSQTTFNNLKSTFNLDQPSKVATANFDKPLSDVDLLGLKVDRSLMMDLDKWLGKYGIQLPNSLMNTIEQLDLCPEKASDGIRREYNTWNMFTVTE